MGARPKGEIEFAAVDLSEAGGQKAGEANNRANFKRNVSMLRMVLMSCPLPLAQNFTYDQFQREVIPLLAKSKSLSTWREKLTYVQDVMQILSSLCSTLVIKLDNICRVLVTIIILTLMSTIFPHIPFEFSLFDLCYTSQHSLPLTPTCRSLLFSSLFFQLLGAIGWIGSLSTSPSLFQCLSLNQCRGGASPHPSIHHHSNAA